MGVTKLAKILWSVRKGRLEQEARNLNFWWKNSKYLSIFCYQSKFNFFWKISPSPIWWCQHSCFRDSAASHMPFRESSYFTYGLDSPEKPMLPCDSKHLHPDAFSIRQTGSRYLPYLLSAWLERSYFWTSQPLFICKPGVVAAVVRAGLGLGVEVLANSCWILPVSLGGHFF